MENFTEEQLAEIAELNLEATETTEASAKVSAFRLKLAIRGAKAAAFAVAVMTLLFRMDPRSSLGKATGNALKSFEVFSSELEREIAAAKAAAQAAQAAQADPPPADAA